MTQEFIRGQLLNLLTTTVGNWMAKALKLPETYNNILKLNNDRIRNCVDGIFIVDKHTQECYNTLSLTHKELTC